MLSYSTCFKTDISTLDKVLYDGDALYQTIINNLKADGKFIHSLLSLDEIPDIFEVWIGKFIVEKQHIVSGILVDTHEGHGLPTLHYVLKSALTSVSSGVLTTGTICPAVFKKNDLYFFFYSHSHGQNGLSSFDVASIIVSFSSLDDLVTYLYAFYDSMKIDMSLHFDFLPINVRMSNKEQSSKAQLESCLDAYFKDQKVRQARKAQSQVGCTDVPIETSGAKKKKSTSRTEYFKMIKRNQRGNEGVLAKECAAKAIARKKSGVLTKECAEKKLARQNAAFKTSEKEHQRASKQEARKKPGVLENECTAKAITRKKPGVLAKESAEQKLGRQNPTFKANEKEHQRASKEKVRKKPGVLAKESAEKKLAGQNPAFKTSEKEHQRASKQEARKKPGVLENECTAKAIARKKPGVLAKESAEKS